MAYSINAPFGVVVPQGSFEWRHEFMNDSRSVTSKYAVDPFNTFFVIPTENPDRDYFALAVGVSAVFSRGISSFLNYETVLGLKDVTSHAFTGGVRLELQTFDLCGQRGDPFLLHALDEECELGDATAQHHLLLLQGCQLLTLRHCAEAIFAAGDREPRSGGRGR